jgi:alpha-galactosidase
MRAQHQIGNAVITAEVREETQLLDDGLLLRGDPVRIEAPAAAVAFFRHGWQSWSPTGWVKPTDRPVPAPPAEVEPGGDDPGYAGRQRHGGNALGAIECADGNVLLLGALGLGGRVEVDDDGTMTAEYEAGDGDWFATYGAEADVFARYASALGQHVGARKRPSPTVWCSWYSLYRDITESNLLEALDGVEGLAFDSFQIDDGWEKAIGDWHPNADFPSGMDGMADRIRTAGYVPGLWLAPFIAHESSQLYRDHPEFCLRSDDGEPVPGGNNWGGAFYGLDVTHPGTQEFVVDVIRRAVGWGYTYLKLDFIYGAALPGRRHEDMPREEAYRRGVELMREAAGEDVYLLACGAPIVASLGVFDGIRIGPDVAPYWEDTSARRYTQDLSMPNTRSAIATSVHRIWLEPLIDIDPDVAYFRTRHNDLDDRQRALLQDLATICGFRATSDPPAWLEPAERERLATFLTAQPNVRRVSRYGFAIDDRVVDFTAVASPASGWPAVGS